VATGPVGFVCPQRFERRLLGAPDRVVVDQVTGPGRAQTVHSGPYGRVGGTVRGRLLDPEIERVDEAPAGRRVRGRRYRPDRGHRVQRVEQHGTGATTGG